MPFSAYCQAKVIDKHELQATGGNPTAGGGQRCLNDRGMERNRLKRKLAAGELGLISGNYENADMIDFIGSLGVVDGVWIDMEHSPVTWSRLADMSRAADLWGMTSIVRVRDNDPTIISLTLG